MRTFYKSYWTSRIQQKNAQLLFDFIYYHIGPIGQHTWAEVLRQLITQVDPYLEQVNEADVRRVVRRVCEDEALAALGL